MIKIDRCKSNPKKSSITKLSEHIPSDFSMSTNHLLKTKKINTTYIRVETAWKILQVLKRACNEDN